MIEFRCEACGKTFVVPDQYAGRRAKCKACGGDVQVPGGVTTAVAAAVPSANAVEPATVSTTPVAGSSDLAAAKVPLRTRRLTAEAEQMRLAFGGGDGPIRLLSAEGNPPERYRIAYRLRGLDRPGRSGDEPPTRHDHTIEIECTAEYPRISPRCRILTPIFHPNFDLATICVGDHWTAGERLVDLVVRIGEMIAYQAYNVKSPLNGEAAMWADMNRDRLPVDRTDLHAQVDRLTTA